jgi:hypothetical protein
MYTHNPPETYFAAQQARKSYGSACNTAAQMTSIVFLFAWNFCAWFM